MTEVKFIQQTLALLLTIILDKSDVTQESPLSYPTLSFLKTEAS